jgi:predicted outer membrane repeat protein
MLPFVYTPQAAAATLNVCASGCPFTTIQSAVDHAAAGDTIAIAAGTYFENVTIPGNRLTLQGVGRRRVVIDGNLKGPVFTIGNGQSFDTGDTITFSELTIMRGFSSSGGGIVVLNSSPLVIQHSILLSNRSTGSGGAVQTGSGSITVADCNFINNQAVADGGGLELTNEDLTLTVSDSVFSHNSAGIYGGAIHTVAHVTQGTFTNTSFVQNQAQWGGALNLGNLYGAQLNFTDVTLSGNSATNDGGGLFFEGGAVFTRSIVTHNVAGKNGGGISGGPRFKGPSALSLVDSEVVWNTAGGQGGGIFENFDFAHTDSTIAHNTPNDCVDSTGALCP